MLTPVQMIVAYKTGRLDECKNELVRYGQVIHDTTLEDETGCYRYRMVNYQAKQWEVTMRNGEVIELGWNPLP